MLLVEQVVEHDHHQRDDQPQSEVFVKWIQAAFPPALPSVRIVSVHRPVMTGRTPFHLQYLAGGRRDPDPLVQSLTRDPDDGIAAYHQRDAASFRTRHLSVDKKFFYLLCSLQSKGPKSVPGAKIPYDQRKLYRTHIKKGDAVSSGMEPLCGGYRDSGKPHY
jgi:hypothetical protein